MDILCDKWSWETTHHLSLFFKRGYCEAQLNNFSESILDYKKALKFNSFLYKSNFNIASDYCALGNDSIALIYFEKAIKIEPSNIYVKIEINDCKNRIKIHGADQNL